MLERAMWFAYIYIIYIYIYIVATSYAPIYCASFDTIARLYIYMMIRFPYFCIYSVQSCRKI